MPHPQPARTVRRWHLLVSRRRHRPRPVPAPHSASPARTAPPASAAARRQARSRATAGHGRTRHARPDIHGSRARSFRDRGVRAHPDAPGAPRALPDARSAALARRSAGRRRVAPVGAPPRGTTHPRGSWMRLPSETANVPHRCGVMWWAVLRWSRQEVRSLCDGGEGSKRGEQADIVLTRSPCRTRKCFAGKCVCYGKPLIAVQTRGVASGHSAYLARP